MSHRRVDFAALLLNLLQLAIDLIACLAGFVISYSLYQYTRTLESLKLQPHTPELQDYYRVAMAFTVIVIVSFTVKHLYQSRETGLMNMDEATGVLQGLFFASAVVICASYFMVDQRTSRISRLIVGVGIASSCLSVLIGRALGFKLRRYLQARGHFFRRLVLCGAGQAGKIVARKLLHSPKFHVLPVAFVDDDPAKQGQAIECLTGHEPLPVAGRLADLGAVLERFEAHEVWITMPGSDQTLFIRIAELAGQARVPCRFVPNLYQIPLQTLTVDTLGGVPLISIKPRATLKPMPVSKRVFDIAVSVLVFCGSLPLWPILVWLIKRSSPGPALFTQQRIGQGGRPFLMYKFRTMYLEAPAYAETPRHTGDSRVTPVGRWLRKLSLDELPQFWNVLKGDMSVVGPRPEMPQIVETYDAIQRQRLCVKPGITGVWQISADRKNPIHENIDYDLYYIEKQSLSLDIMILLTTFVYGARGV